MRAQNHQVGLGVVAVASALIAQNAGAAFAKHLFPVLGATGMTALRVSLAAGMVLALRWKHLKWPERSHLGPLLGYGTSLGIMNLCIYLAFARIPIGIAVGIEIIGPISVALVTARRALDYFWLALAVFGLLMLLPIWTGARLDMIGIAFALGAALCWAAYILFGQRISDSLGSDAVAWGMLIATGITLPVGLADAGTSIFAPELLLSGLAIAVLSSALPYLLEIRAMRMLPPASFAILLSAAPAVAALSGFLILGEQVSLKQACAIAAIMMASGGTALTAASRRWRADPAGI
jgi:inner membrane transporter RhtA